MNPRRIETGGTNRTILRLFQLSGFCGIMYQVLWTRLFTGLLGSSTLSVSAVVTAFLLGLALGAFFFGKLADRRENGLRLYAILEIASALAAALSFVLLPWADDLYRSLYGRLPYGVLKGLVFLLAMGFITLPTLFMGGALPALVRHSTTNTDSLKQHVGRLYAMNTLGAAWGAFVLGVVLIRFLGYGNTIILAIALNLAVGAAALWLSRRSRPAGIVPDPVPAPDRANDATRIRPGMLLAVFAASGFAALGCEILWFRMVSHLICETITGFAVVLAVYLFGLSLGSLLWSRAPADRSDDFRAYAGLQIVIALLALIFLPALVLSAGRSALASRAAILAGIALIALFMGGTFPLAARLYGRNMTLLGRQVGAAYAANTLGSVAGALLCGFVLIPRLGSPITLLLLSLLNASAAVIMLRRVLLDPAPDRSSPAYAPIRRRHSLIAAAILLLPLVMFAFSSRDWFGQFHRHAARLADPTFTSIRSIGSAESRIQSLHVYEQPDGHRHLVAGPYVSGSTVPSRRLTQQLQGHLAMLLHPHPDRVLEIGYGVGEILRTVLAHEPSRVDLVEIDEAMIPLADRFFASINNRSSRAPAVRIHIMDGRHFLKMSRDRYDLIMSDSMILQSEGSLRLYTREHFQAGREHLAPDGIMCAWLPLYIGRTKSLTILRTFMEVFPDSILWMNPMNGESFLFGFNGDRHFDPAAFGRRYAAVAHDDLEVWGWDSAPPLMAGFKGSPATLQALVAAHPAVHRDIQPVLDFTGYDSHWDLLTELGRQDSQWMLQELPADAATATNAPGQLSGWPRRLDSLARADRVFWEAIQKLRAPDTAGRTGPDLEAAATLARQALEIDPTHPGARTLLADLYAQQAAAVASSAPADAREFWRNALAMNPFHEAANLALAESARIAGNTAAAQGHAWRLHRANPCSIQAIHLLMDTSP